MQNGKRLKSFLVQKSPLKQKPPRLPLRQGSWRKINELQAMIFDEESASDVQKFLAPPKCRILPKKSTPISFRKKSPKIVLGVEKWNVGNRLKRVFAKFDADRSYL